MDIVPLFLNGSFRRSHDRKDDINSANFEDGSGLEKSSAVTGFMTRQNEQSLRVFNFGLQSIVRWGNEDDERIKIHIKQNERNIELVMIML
jgi:hypothetical protein